MVLEVSQGEKWLGQLKSYEYKNVKGWWKWLKKHKWIKKTNILEASGKTERPIVCNSPADRQKTDEQKTSGIKL